jgi:hypothetical protein
VVSGTVAISAPGQAKGLTVTLHGFDHGADQTSGPQEVLTVSSEVAADGTYRFENVEMPLNRIFLADVEYAGIKYRSEFESAGEGSTSISLPPLNVYEPSTDVGLLQIDQVHVYTDFATTGTVQVLEIFAFTNSSDRAVIISTDGVTIPFIPLPAGAVNQGYEAGQDSASFVAPTMGLRSSRDRPTPSSPSSAFRMRSRWISSSPFPSIHNRCCCWCRTASKWLASSLPLKACR